MVGWCYESSRGKQHRKTPKVVSQRRATSGCVQAPLLDSSAQRLYGCTTRVTYRMQFVMVIIINQRLSY